MPQTFLDSERLVHVALDPISVECGTPAQEQERALALYDLLEKNKFKLVRRDDSDASYRGPYRLILGVQERKLVFDIQTPQNEAVVMHSLSMTPFWRLIKEYTTICESYYAAIRTESSSMIEAIDMGRRGLHNDAADLVMARLAGKIKVDFETARRLFTLIFALHWRP
jgi:uncharacterized protein (UPF0262 family)